jgi:hypothetical protein
LKVNDDSKWEVNETIIHDLFGLTRNAQFTRNCGLGTTLNDD